MSKTKPRPPAHLSSAAKTWFTKVAAENKVNGAQAKLLAMAAETWDRYERARKTLDAQGVTYTDRFGAPRSRPEVAVERDSRLAFVRMLRELGLAEVDLPTPPAGKFAGVFG